jgi:hypothetical protein
MPDTWMRWSHTAQPICEISDTRQKTVPLSSDVLFSPVTPLSAVTDLPELPGSGKSIGKIRFNPLPDGVGKVMLVIRDRFHPPDLPESLTCSFLLSYRLLSIFETGSYQSCQDSHKYSSFYRVLADQIGNGITGRDIEQVMKERKWY